MLKKSFYTIIYENGLDTLIYNTKNGVQIMVNDSNESLRHDLTILKEKKAAT